MGDTYWMENRTKEVTGIEWGDSLREFRHLFRKPAKSSKPYSTYSIDSQIQDYIIQKIKYPPTETGSQYLDPVWRHNILKINTRPVKIQALISLN